MKINRANGTEPEGQEHVVVGAPIHLDTRRSCSDLDRVVARPGSAGHAARESEIIGTACSNELRETAIDVRKMHTWIARLHILNVRNAANRELQIKGDSERCGREVKNIRPKRIVDGLRAVKGSWVRVITAVATSCVIALVQEDSAIAAAIDQGVISHAAIEHRRNRPGT